MRMEAHEHGDSLPPLVREFAARSAPAAPAQSRVRITQRGEMWLRPGGRGMRFTATQELAGDRVAFAWRARFPLAGPLALSVVDAYDGTSGELTVRLLGLPLQRERGPETSAGEALRYLAELPFVPPAFFHNQELEWRQLTPRSVEVAASINSERLSVAIEFDEAGDIVHTSSQMRPRKVDGQWTTTPWGGEFRRYAHLGALRVPTSGEAYWDLPEGRYVYWRGEVLSAQLLVDSSLSAVHGRAESNSL